MSDPAKAENSDAEHRRLFNAWLSSNESLVGLLLDDENYEKVVKLLTEVNLDKPTMKRQEFYRGLGISKNTASRWTMRYRLISVGTDTSMLALNADFAKAKHIIQNTPQVAKQSQAFDLIREAHLAVGHAAGEKTHQELHRRWSGISRKLCDMYCKICSCVTQKTQLVRPTDLTPILLRTLYSRG
jgi:hypothetical protein